MCCGKATTAQPQRQPTNEMTHFTNETIEEVGKNVSHITDIY